ncbi:hypothetical protein Hanom_Chr01g00040951 [Helianthus anomalus]
MMFKTNKTSLKQEFIGKDRKHEIKENREIRPEQSSLSRSKLQPDDSLTNNLETRPLPVA